MPDAPLLNVEVAYAEPQRQWLLVLQVAPGATLADAIRASGILEQAHLDLGRILAGVHSQARPLDSVLADGDRIEIYRPLQADPKTARRRRAGRGR